MSKTILTEGDEGVKLIVKNVKAKAEVTAETRSPVHVVYGGADRFSAGTPRKLGDLALASIKDYAPNFVEFAQAMSLPGAETLPHFPEAVAKLERQISRSLKTAKTENYFAWFCWTIHRRTLEKLGNEPVEDFRIDFEDGYGFRPNEEEDGDAVKSAEELAKAFLNGSVTYFSGIRIKPFSVETYGRAARTLELFLNTLVEKTGGLLPANFVITLPKITDRKQVRQLCTILKDFEKNKKMRAGTIGVEVMIETPLSIIDRKGQFALKAIVDAAKGRCTSAHFGAFDYTAALGISSEHQHLRHAACNFARQMMLVNLAPLGVRLSDSVTTQLPVPVHKTGRLSEIQKAENRRSVHAGWREHFTNVSASIAGGFYQSWDLHPNQLAARYAAVFSFFLGTMSDQGGRLKSFFDDATKARLTGTTFDDAASAQGIINFFRRGLSCGAITKQEAVELTGLSVEQLNSQTFQQIIESIRTSGKS